MSENERVLLELARKGDISAFEQLIGGYQRKIFNLILRMIGNYDDACELSQEALIKIFKSVKSFKGDCKFSTWVYRISTNVCLDEIRKRKNNKVTSLDENINFGDGDIKKEIEDYRPTPEVAAERNAIRKTIIEAINCLSAEHRVVIVLRDINGFGYEEIAQILKCPEGTVKSRINRARQALREILKSKKELLGVEFVNY